MKPRWARPVFVGYALLLAFGTHKPNLVIDEGPIPRPDIFIHIGAFAVWTVLLARCRFFGPWGSTRNLLIAGLVAACYSAIDEATQALPFIHRQAGLDDGLANVAGVVLGMLIGWGLGLADNRRRTKGTTDFARESRSE